MANFSIIITCFNQAEYIRQAVESALLQECADGEVIVVDDGSTDESLAILQNYRDKIRLLTLKNNCGAIAARNYGAKYARGKYIVFLDGDDMLLPWALVVYETLIRTCRPTVILGRAHWFEGAYVESFGAAPCAIRFVSYSRLIEKDRSAGLSASTYVVERAAFEGVGGWTPEIFHLDLQDLSMKLGLVPAVLICEPATACYRIHEHNSIHSIAPFLVNAHRLLRKEKRGRYPGGRRYRFRRQAWFGGLWLFWVKRAVRAGYYADGLRLAWAGRSMILFGILRRMFVLGIGREPVGEVRLSAGFVSNACTEAGDAYKGVTTSPVQFSTTPRGDGL